MKKGFTLIEVLLSLAIFTIIGITTVKYVSQIAQTKFDALSELEVYDRTRSALSVLSFDLSQAFHIQYEDLGKEVERIIKNGGSAPHTLFDGRQNELVFTSLSHRVYYAGLKEGDQTEISYFLQEVQGKEGLTFFKRESPRIDEDLYQGGVVYTLLEGVEKLEFEYWNPKVEKWISDWNSDGRDFKDKFPAAIKIKLSVLRENRDPLQVEQSIKIAFPNNEKNGILATF